VHLYEFGVDPIKLIAKLTKIDEAGLQWEISFNRPLHSNIVRSEQQILDSLSVTITGVDKSKYSYTLESLLGSTGVIKISFKFNSDIAKSPLNVKFNSPELVVDSASNLLSNP
jgi:hypothetical protein